MTLGAYQLRADGSVGWGCLDVDADEATDHARGLARELATLLVATLRQTGLSPSVEFTGNKGFHVWLFAPDGCPARDMRRLLEWAAGTVQEEHGEFAGVHVEVFPKQTPSTEGDYGNLVKVPGPLQEDRPSLVFVDEASKPYRDQASSSPASRRTWRRRSPRPREWVPEELAHPIDGGGRPGAWPDDAGYLEHGAGGGGE